jgi:hypothetical protein
MLDATVFVLILVQKDRFSWLEKGGFTIIYQRKKSLYLS